MKITTVGLDLAKSVFTLQGVDQRGSIVLRKTDGAPGHAAAAVRATAALRGGYGSVLGSPALGA